MKIGQQVHLTFSPECKGTVSAVEQDRIRVTWPQQWATVGKQVSRVPRKRVWYDKSAAKFLAA
jgi:hypothetical protein